jgi:hypothetical protein
MRWTVLMVALGCGGCVHASLTTLSPNTYPAISIDEVTVLADISELAVDTIRYERLALIHMTGSSDGLTNAEDLIRKAREEAAKIGANAIVLSGYEPGRVSTISEGSAIAVRYWIVPRLPSHPAMAPPALLR